MGDINERVNVGTAMVVRCGKYVLLGKRAGGKHGEGQWSLPGGKPDPGEHPLDAAVRELHEETDIFLDPNDYMCPRVDTIPFWSYERFPEHGMHYVTLYFRVEIDPNLAATVKNMEPEKCEGWVWTPVEARKVMVPRHWLLYDDGATGQGYWQYEPTFGAIETLASRGLL